MNLILSDEEKLQDEDTSPNKQNDNKAQTMACDNVGCVYSASTKRCTIRANVDVNGDERIGPSELKSYGHPFDYSDANHNYRTSKQGQQFDLYTSSNVLRSAFLWPSSRGKDFLVQSHEAPNLRI